MAFSSIWFFKEKRRIHKISIKQNDWISMIETQVFKPFHFKLFAENRSISWSNDLFRFLIVALNKILVLWLRWPWNENDIRVKIICLHNIHVCETDTVRVKKINNFKIYIRILTDYNRIWSITDRLSAKQQQQKSHEHKSIYRRYNTMHYGLSMKGQIRKIWALYIKMKRISGM